MYTHVSVSRDEAERLFRAFARKPLQPGEIGVVTGATLDEHFREYGATYLDKLGAGLEQDRRNDCFVLKFREYLAHLPQEFVDLEIMPTKVEIVRYNSAPTKARAGYYEDPATGMTATVEMVVPSGDGKLGSVYAQIIKISGSSLRMVQHFNTELSRGRYNRRFLVNAFE